MAKDWRSRVVRTEHDVDPATLIPNPHNWRTHPTAQQDALTAVLDDVGWLGRVTVNERSGHVVDGHLRVELARRTGRRVPIVDYVDLTDREEATILATYDPLSALAEADSEQLRALVEAAGLDDAALLDMLTRWLPPADPAPDDGLVDGDGQFGTTLGFLITVVAKDAATRDLFVSAIESAGGAPTVSAHRE